MVLQDARKLANTEMLLRWRDRNGEFVEDSVFIFQLQFIPMYGPCLITSHGEIHIDKIDRALPAVPEVKTA